MPQDQDVTRPGVLRVSLQEPELQELMRQFPKLSRTEISDVISRYGPMRNDVETELLLISSRKS
jgi:hypothetical protein